MRVAFGAVDPDFEAHLLTGIGDESQIFSMLYVDVAVVDERPIGIGEDVRDLAQLVKIGEVEHGILRYGCGLGSVRDIQS